MAEAESYFTSLSSDLKRNLPPSPHNHFKNIQANNINTTQKMDWQFPPPWLSGPWPPHSCSF